VYELAAETRQPYTQITTKEEEIEIVVDKHYRGIPVVEYRVGQADRDTIDTYFSRRQMQFNVAIKNSIKHILAVTIADRGNTFTPYARAKLAKGLENHAQEFAEKDLFSTHAIYTKDDVADAVDNFLAITGQNGIDSNLCTMATRSFAEIEELFEERVRIINP
jgi:hypothetical protein